MSQAVVPQRKSPCSRRRAAPRLSPCRRDARARRCPNGPSGEPGAVWPLSRVRIAIGWVRSCAASGPGSLRGHHRARSQRR